MLQNHPLDYLKSQKNKSEQLKPAECPHNHAHNDKPDFGFLCALCG